MTKQQIYTWFAAILTTLAETDGSPESMIYIAMGMNMSDWTDMRSLLISGGFITISGNYVELTAAGRETAQELNAVLASP